MISLQKYCLYTTHHTYMILASSIYLSVLVDDVLTLANSIYLSVLVDDDMILTNSIYLSVLVDDVWTPMQLQKQAPEGLKYVSILSLSFLVWAHSISQMHAYLGYCLITCSNNTLFVVCTYLLHTFTQFHRCKFNLGNA